MKKFFLSVFLLGVTLVLGLLAVIFFKPTWLLNPDSLAWLLNRSGVFESWSWKSARIEHQWIGWNDRRISGGFDHFCLHYKKPGQELNTCLDINWNFLWRYDFKHGFTTKTIQPFSVSSPETSLKLTHVPDSSPSDQSSAEFPPDIFGLWQKIWASYIPDTELDFKKITFHKEGKTYEFDFSFSKQQKKLKASALEFNLYATPSGFELRAPDKYLVPEKFKLHGPWYLRGVKLLGKFDKYLLVLELNGALEVVEFIIKTQLDLPIKHPFTSLAFQRAAILATQGEINIPGVKNTLSRYAPDPFKELPAPFNVMDGDIRVDITTAALKDNILIRSLGHIDLKSPKQVLNVDLGANVPFNLQHKKLGAVELDVDFKQVKIQLPRFSKKSPPPQFIPDKRFQKVPYNQPTTRKKSNLNLNLTAENEKSLQLRTNLLDEVLRLNFDLAIAGGSKTGYVSVLPLKTTLFKRPIRLVDLKINYQDPLDPVIASTIRFPLPEYKITLNLEGPLSKPRYAFSSEPPLPQNDIYAVLLFGRPMADLKPDDKTAAQKTNQLLSQGILSLSVLYFLAGSPVEYVGFDPDSQNATAQFGLGRKTSLRVGGGQEGVNSSSIRRSLGKGWYLDTSVQNTNPALGGQDKSYGVLLERVINY
jgi:hypothetical protein